MKIILISGKAEHGKNALADYLKEKLENQGEKVVIDMFAKYIKMYCKQMGWDGITKDEYWRMVLQLLGTEEIQDKLNYKAFHAKRMCEDVQILNRVFEVDTFIISDTRFKNEIYHTKAIFPDETISVRINRLGHKSKLTEEQLNHKSETDLDDFNFDYNIITQDGIGHLHDEADRVLSKVLKYKGEN